MKSKAQVGDHPIHPMLVALPIGLWVFSLVADLFYLAGMHSNWRFVGTYCMAGGCCAGLIAALPGVIDYGFITDPKARRTATWHMVINAFLIVLYAYNFFLRLDRDLDPAGIPLALSFVGIVLLSASGWLGGELVYMHKIGVVEKEGWPHHEYPPESTARRSRPERPRVVHK